MEASLLFCNILQHQVSLQEYSINVKEDIMSLLIEYLSLENVPNALLTPSATAMHQCCKSGSVWYV